MSTVSVLLPVFNAENYISETIDSILTQSFTDYEIIIVDDCSSDNTFNICYSLSLLDNRIHLYRNTTNLGAGLTRNECLKYAQSRYICFIDSDDVWLPHKLSKQLAFLKASNAPICHTSYSLIDSNSKKIPGGVVVSNKVDLFSYMKTTEIGMSTSMLDLTKIGSINFSPLRTRQDTLLWLSLLDAGFYSVGLNENLVQYRIRKGQISSNKFKMLFRTLFVYMTVKSVPKHLVIFLYLSYIKNAILKRL